MPLTLAIILYFLGSSISEGHIGEGPIPVYYIIDGTALDMEDGTLADWQALGIPPSLTTEDFRLESLGDVRRDDEVRVWLGWHGDRLYMGAERIDQQHVNEFTGNDKIREQADYLLQDRLEFIVDGDHNGGRYIHDDTGQTQLEWQWYALLAGTPPGIETAWLGPGWPASAGHAVAGGKSSGTTPDTSVVEISVAAFDSLARDDISASVRTDLQAGDIVGLGVIVWDIEPGPGNVKYVLEAGKGGLYADRLLDAILMPLPSTVIEDFSWAKIKQYQRRK